MNVYTKYKFYKAPPSSFLVRDFTSRTLDINKILFILFVHYLITLVISYYDVLHEQNNNES